MLGRAMTVKSGGLSELRSENQWNSTAQGRPTKAEKKSTLLQLGIHHETMVHLVLIDLINGNFFYYYLIFKY